MTAYTCAFYVKFSIFGSCDCEILAITNVVLELGSFLAPSFSLDSNLGRKRNYEN